MLMSLHLKTSFVAGSAFPADEIVAKQELFKSFLDEQAYLQSRIVSLREKIDENQLAATSHSESANLKNLNTLKESVGLSQISGRGVEIILDDSPLALREGANPSDSNLVQASDLRDIVNLLFAADSSAIMVNGQRIIATSPVSSLGTSILINNSYTTPPFVISAVGDTDKALQMLSNKSFLPEIYEKSEKSMLVFDIYLKNKIVIPIYNAALKSDYLNLVE